MCRLTMNSADAMTLIERASLAGCVQWRRQAAAAAVTTYGQGLPLALQAVTTLKVTGLDTAVTLHPCQSSGQPAQRRIFPASH